MPPVFSHLGADLPEFFHPVVESQDLGGADEGEVERVEEEDEVLAEVVRQLELLELAVEDGGAGEEGGRLADHGLGHLGIVQIVIL